MVYLFNLIIQTKVAKIVLSGGAKYTFGFNAQGRGEGMDWEYKGQFQFNDHNGTKIHIDEITVFKVCMSGEIAFRGFNKDDVYVRVIVVDDGERGIGDEIEVRIGCKKYYGVLGGGNIKAHYDD
jgi:hypothetical protein